MDILNDLKATWRSADTQNLPDVQTFKEVAAPFRNHRLKRKFLIILLSITLSVFFMVMMYIDTSRMISTLVGEGLLVVSLLILAYTNARSVKRFYMLDNCSNREFMNFLEQTRKNQTYYYKRTQVIAMTIYSMALLLYLFEFAHSNLIFMIITYTCTVIALAIFWLVVRPKTYKKEVAKLQQLSERTQAIAKQFE
ncbi:MAG: hypothetical protein ABIN95_03105 [Mucilaginibacter sp.]